ncbi:MAG: 3-hydroxyacyl-CoA dehydrogenase family protein [Deltaproteobacteria bacterium]|nr:3-hydroxyacyl-CoA dehydrogenase family protein [Deltaproteobacteria bacterium]
MKKIDRAVVVGAGTMGHGIAQVLAQAGIDTTLVDVSQGSVDRGLAKIRENLEAGVAKGKVTAAARDLALGNLSGTTQLESALGAADLLVEAIPEDMSKKRELFALADAKMHAAAILASNTSSLSITEIASATKRPEHVVGLHFFNPVHIMKLLEVVKGALTAPAVLDTVRALGERLGKTCIVVNDSPGFATSRLGLAVGLEATRMLEEGVASASDIDTAMKLGYGYPMGPLALGDLVGLDVRLAIAEAMFEELGSDTFRPPRLLKKLVRLGHLGKKAGRGFFVYDEKGTIVGDNPAAKPAGTGG